LTLGPTILKRLMAQIDASRYDERLAPDRFTLREVIAHVADLEPVILGRMQLALSTPGAAVSNWDQDQEAITKNYSSWDVWASLETFAAERSKPLELYESLTDEQTRRTVNHPLLGEMSIFDLAVFALGHDAYHVEQLSRYLPK
jgi:uncharacterized damage-inducible protein DinB